MTCRFRLLHALVAMWMALSGLLAAAPAMALTLDPAHGRYSLAGALAWYRDPGGTLTAAEVSALDDDRFVRAPAWPGFGYTRDTIWVRFETTARGSGTEWLLTVAPAFLDHVQLFHVSGDEIVDLGIQGDHHAWSPRAVPWRYSTWPLPLVADQPTTFYLRIASSSSLAVQPAIWQRGALLEHEARGLLLIALPLAAGALIAVLSLFFYWTLRDRLYLYFSCYAFAFTFVIAQLEGVLHLLAMPAAPLRLEPLQALFLAIGICAMVVLCLHLLDLPRSRPLLARRLRRAALALSGVGLLPAAAGRVEFAIPFFSLLLALLSLVVPGVMLRLRRQLGRIVWLYVLAFAVISIGALFRFAWVFGLTGPNVVSEHNFFVSVLAHLVIMFMTLATRYVRAERRLHRAREQALESIRSSERNLEQLVRQRTLELDRANAHLNAQLTTLEATRDRLAVALEAEQRAAHEQQNFLHMVAHEFRTPLSVIRMAADLIRCAPQAARAHVDLNCDRIIQASERMASLVEQALRQDRLGASAWRGHAEPVAVRELLETARRYGEMVAAGSRRFEVECAPGLVVRGDPDLLLTALNNIVDNAVKYSPAGSTIALHARRQDADVVLAVTDQGCGMSEAECAQVVEKYFRAPGAADVPGMGLGLYLVDRIVRLHDARLDIRSRPGHGTTFRLVFTQPATTVPGAADLEGTSAIPG